MKKLLVILVLLASCKEVNAQFKIGNITLDSATASKYFSDCFNHPDTVMPKSSSDFLGCENCSISNEEIQRAKIMADEFNSNLEKNNIGQVNDTIFYEAYNDTLYDGTLAASFDFKKGAKKITIEHIKAGSYVDWKGYLMPRRPSEQDFIKWYHKD